MRWGLKKHFIPCQELSNDMWHTTCTKVNQGNSRLVVVRSQIGSLSPDPSFGHNLCFKYPNGSCEPILDIYISKYFQWYKEISIQWVLPPEISLWKFRNPSRFQLPKWEPTWECGGSFPHIFLHSWELEMWLLGFIFSSYLCKPLPCCEPKVKVTIVPF